MEDAQRDPIFHPGWPSRECMEEEPETPQLPGSHALSSAPYSPTLVLASSGGAADAEAKELPPPSIPVQVRVPDTPPAQAKGNDGDEALLESVRKPGFIPNEELSKGAIDKRFRRVFKPRKDGTFLVSEDFVKKYRSLGDERDQLMVMFEKCNYEPDMCCQSVWGFPGQ